MLFSGFIKFLTANNYKNVSFNAFYIGTEFSFGY